MTTNALRPAPLPRATGTLVGMVHVGPTPGSPGFPGMPALRDRALRDTEVLVAAGFDMLIIENMHDFPPLREADMGPEVPAAMTALALAVRALVPPRMPVGIQVLFAAHRVAMAVALAARLDLIRAEAWTHGHLADKGWAEATAATTVRYADRIGAPGVRIWADVKKKHASHAVTSDLELGDIVATLELHGAHAAVITGSQTGEPPDADDFRRAKERTPLPLVLGSGLTVQNAPRYVPLADAFIVGTSIKEEGEWRNPVDPERARALVGTIRDLC